MTVTAIGLEGVVAAETALSRVDGAAGTLWLRGLAVEDLAGRVSFEEACAHLWTGDAAGVPGLRAALGRARAAAHERLAGLGDALDRADPMDALRAAVAHLPSSSGREEIVGAVGVFVGAWARRQRGAGPVPPDPERGHAADLARGILGIEPDAERVAALETYLVTVMDHGLNASTFAARVVASTRSDAVSAVVAALGALKGPLHGGAPGPVLDMLDAIGAPDRAEAWLREELAAGRRIMGMGHRVYRVRDPRAAVLEGAVAALRVAGGGGARLAVAAATEAAATALLRERHPDRPLAANVEFYTAVLLEAVGIDRRLFSAVFAAARCVGWLGHVAEQRAVDRLIRPRARYVGPTPPGASAAE